MYQIIHTIYQTDQIVIHQAKNGNIPMVSISINKRIDLMPLAQCGGLCLKVSKELGAKLEVTNPKIVLIEDAKLAENKTDLYFIGELYHLNDQDQMESHQTESVRRILIELYKAYNSLLKQNKQLDFSLYNLFYVQDQLKVLDIGFLEKKLQKDSTPTNQLALLILKLFMSRQQFKPLKYMNSQQQIEYIRKFKQYLILLPMLEEIQKRISWENLGYYLLQDFNKQEATQSIPTMTYYKSPYKLNSSLNSYSLAVQRMQSNLRSRSKRNIGSLYEHQKTSINGQDDDSQENQRITRSRRIINPNINHLRPESMNSTPNHYKLEHPYNASPSILNAQSQTQQIRTSFKTENSLKTIQQYISYDNFFLRNQTITPEDSQSKFQSINVNLSQNYNSQQDNQTQNEQLTTLQQLQEKSTIQHEKRIFKLPQHKQLPQETNESTIKVVKVKEDLSKEFEQYYNIYKHYIECLNMIGKTVAKCINILDAKNNLWMMPLFIVFKRMYQLRKSLETIVETNQNIYDLQYYSEFFDSQKYQDFKDEFISQNNIVKTEVQTLLQNCETKIDKLEKKNQQKIIPLLSLNLDQSIRDISFIYFYQQIYSYIKKLMVERPKQAQQLRDLIVKIQCSLLIMDQSIKDFKFDLQEYNNRKSDEQYRQENELKLEKIKMRIQKSGYQF